MSDLRLLDAVAEGHPREHGEQHQREAEEDDHGVGDLDEGVGGHHEPAAAGAVLDDGAVARAAARRLVDALEGRRLEEVAEARAAVDARRRPRRVPLDEGAEAREVLEALEVVVGQAAEPRAPGGDVRREEVRVPLVAPINHIALEDARRRVAPHLERRREPAEALRALPRGAARSLFEAGALISAVSIA